MDEIRKMEETAQKRVDIAFQRAEASAFSGFAFSADWDVCTFFHFVEEQLQVPYRFFKNFTGEIENQASEKWKMYVRNLESDVENAFNIFGRQVEAAGLCRSTAAGSIVLKS